MVSLIFSLLLPLVFAAMALWGSVFHEKDGWRSWGRFGVLLIGSVGLALSMDNLLTLLGPMCSSEMMSECTWKYVLALCYVGVFGVMVLAVFYNVVVDGILGFVSGWASLVGCILSGIVLIVPAWRVGVFVVKSFWWLGLVMLGILAVCGFIIGGSGRISASGQGDGIFVDKHGNEYIPANSQEAYDGSWDWTKKYRIKGQEGEFFRRLR